MPKKTPGSLNVPPPQSTFNRVPLKRFCLAIKGSFCRLHSLNVRTGKPWPPLHFSKRGNTRFDPTEGIGALCVAETLPGALMEIFDDQWGPVGSLGRSITARQLKEWWVTRLRLPWLLLFDATGPNLSKIGTDAQLLTGAYQITRQWALRLMRHPLNIDGIFYSSRHDPQRRNIALFQRPDFLPAQHTVALDPAEANGNKIVCGPAVLLENHPTLNDALTVLEVAILP